MNRVNGILCCHVLVSHTEKHSPPVSKCVFEQQTNMVDILVGNCNGPRTVLLSEFAQSHVWLIQSLHLKRKSHVVTVKNPLAGISLLLVLPHPLNFRVGNLFFFLVSQHLNWILFYEERKKPLKNSSKLRCVCQEKLMSSNLPQIIVRHVSTWKGLYSLLDIWVMFHTLLRSRGKNWRMKRKKKPL